MPGTTIKLINRGEIAVSTLAFYFDKPAGFGFDAGQFVEMTLPRTRETALNDDKRTFSIASAPYERELMVATRIRGSAFKDVLCTMPFGTEVEINGPFGSLTLHQQEENSIVILTGGIGITPFRSMVVQAAKSQAARRMFLFYANRRPEDAPFLRELQELENMNQNLKLIPTMTRMEKSRQAWDGETGHIKREMIIKDVANVQQAIFYLAGPPGMLKAMRKLLSEMGIDESNIHAEEFAGY
jgi:ferredoxin-NADP reductase